MVKASPHRGHVSVCARPAAWVTPASILARRRSLVPLAGLVPSLMACPSAIASQPQIFRTVFFRTRQHPLEATPRPAGAFPTASQRGNEGKRYGGRLPSAKSSCSYIFIYESAPKDSAAERCPAPRRDAAATTPAGQATLAFGKVRASTRREFLDLALVAETTACRCKKRACQAPRRSC
jgi:hypothetical protein